MVTSIRAPQVNFNMPTRAPVPEYQSPDIDETADIDWGRVVQGIGRGLAQTKEVEIEQRRTTALNSLAKKALIISERQRQGAINASQADTEFRALRMEGLNAGIGEKEVSDVIGRYNYGIEELEEARQKNMMTAEQNFRNAEIDSARKMYPGIAHLSNVKIQDIFDNINFAFDNVGKYNQQLAMVDPRSEDYTMLKNNRDSEFGDVTYMNMLLDMNTVFTNDGEITPESIQAAKNRAIAIGMKNKLSYEEASLVADAAAKRLGADAVINKNSDFWKQSGEYKKQATEYMVQNYKNKAINTDNVGFFMALAGDEFGKSLMLANTSTWNSAIDSLAMDEKYVDDKGRVRTRTATVLKGNDILGLINGVNRANSNPVFSYYQRGTLTNAAYDTFLVNNEVTPGMSDDALDVVLANTKGLNNSMNPTQAEATANSLSQSADPNERDLGERIKDNEIEIKANANAAQLLKKNNPDNTVVNRLNNSLLANSLRYDEDGMLVVKKSDDLISWQNLGMLFSSDEYKQSVETMNTYLSRIPTAKERIATLQRVYPNIVQPLEINASVEDFAEEGEVSDYEMRQIDRAVNEGEAEMSTGDKDLDILYAELNKDLKPHVRNIVIKAIKEIESRRKNNA